MDGVACLPNFGSAATSTPAQDSLSESETLLIEAKVVRANVTSHFCLKISENELCASVSVAEAMQRQGRYRWKFWEKVIQLNFLGKSTQGR